MCRSCDTTHCLVVEGVDDSGAEYAVHSCRVFKRDKPKSPARERTSHHDMVMPSVTADSKSGEGTHNWIYLFLFTLGAWDGSFITTQSETVPNCSKYAFIFSAVEREDTHGCGTGDLFTRERRTSGERKLTFVRVPTQTPHKELPVGRDKVFQIVVTRPGKNFSYPGSYSSASVPSIGRLGDKIREFRAFREVEIGQARLDPCDRGSYKKTRSV